MLLILSVVLCNSGPVTVSAEEYEVLNVPNLNNVSDALTPSESVEIKIGENKTFKIIVSEYSYYCFRTNECEYVNFNLYSDSSKNNKILSSKNEDKCFSIFLPKGEYFLDLTCDKNAPKGFYNLFYFGKMPIKRFMLGSVTKKKNKFYYDLPCCFIEGDFIGLDSEDGGFYYDTEYSLSYVYIEKNGKSKNNYYNNISFKMYLKDKNSSVKITPTGKTKEILDLEAKGETYDTSNYEEEMKNDASNKKKKDTKKPTVKGVKNNKTYKKSVKFKVSDKSGIKKVTLNKKKIKVSKAKKGYTVKKNGKYTLKVWDKAGNVRTVKFKIKK